MKTIKQKIVTLLIISLFVTSCGFTNLVDRVERPHNDLWENTQAVIVEKREKNYIYARSGGGMYTYKIYNKFGKYDSLDTITILKYPEFRSAVYKIQKNY